MIKQAYIALAVPKFRFAGFCHDSAMFKQAYIALAVPESVELLYKKDLVMGKTSWLVFKEDKKTRIPCKNTKKQKIWWFGKICAVTHNMSQLELAKQEYLYS